jgi:D-lactate dehydrogenase
MKIAFFDVEGWEKEYLESALKGHTLKFFSGHITEAGAKSIKSFDAVSVFVYSKVNGSILKLLPNLRIVAARSTGFDNIDVEECAKRSVVVANVPAYGENTVAEHTFALLLALSRKIPESVNKVKMGHFDLHGIRGWDLKGKFIGIIGLGNIGRHVARIAHGFEMNILAFDLNPDKDFARECGIKYCSYDYILKNADVLTFHVPLNPHTFHLLNVNNVKLMKKGSFVVNTSRGGVVETGALLLGLKKKILAGVGLDVLENETFIPEESVLLSRRYLESQEKDVKLILEEHILTEQDNVIITPHNAFNSKEAIKRILDTTVDNLKCFCKGRCVNAVKKA